LELVVDWERSSVLEDTNVLGSELADNSVGA